MHLSRLSVGVVCVAILLFAILVIGALAVPGGAFNPYLVITVFIWAVVAAGASGIAALVLAFTRYRRSRVAFTCAAASFDLGLILSFFFFKMPLGDSNWEFLLSALPVLFGATGLVRWGWAYKAGEAPGNA
jgi:hypothetical protein